MIFVQEDDLEFLQEAITDPQVWRPIRGSTPYSLDQEREFFENVISDDETVQLLISNEETPIGMIGLEPINQEAGVTEVGYWIVLEYRGEGFGFNDASQRLLEKVGFTDEGVQGGRYSSRASTRIRTGTGSSIGSSVIGRSWRFMSTSDNLLNDPP